MMTRFVSIAAALAVFAAAGAAHADAEAGKKVFNKCRACHKLEEGKNGVGPTLHGVVGRQVATVDGYKYSDAMQAWGEGKSWDEATLASYLSNPKKTVPGTKMSFAGLKKDEDIQNVIDYIEAESQ